ALSLRRAWRSCKFHTPFAKPQGVPPNNTPSYRRFRETKYTFDQRRLQLQFLPRQARQLKLMETIAPSSMKRRPLLAVTVRELRGSDITQDFLETLSSLAEVGLTPDRAKEVFGERLRRGLRGYFAYG